MDFHINFTFIATDRDAAIVNWHKDAFIVCELHTMELVMMKRALKIAFCNKIPTVLYFMYSRWAEMK